MKISIIGSNSYIARNLIYVLSRSDDVELFLYDREPVHKDNCHLYKSIDIFETSSVSEINYNVDIIYMFVGKTGTIDGFSDPDVFVDVNEKSLLHVLNEYVRQKSRAKLIFPSTRLLYDDNGSAKEEDISSSLKTVYAVNKLACEQYIKMYNTVYGIEYCIVRICIPYGNFLDKTYSYGTIGFMLSKAQKGENITLFGDGNVRRTLTFIGDLCDYLIRIGFSENCINDVFNIGGETYSLKEMASQIAEKFGIGIEYTDYPDIALKTESKDTVFDSGKLEKAVGRIKYTSFSDWIIKDCDS